MAFKRWRQLTTVFPSSRGGRAILCGGWMPDKMSGLATCIPFGWTCNFGAGNLPGGAIFIGALYAGAYIIYIYVFIWCWQLENAYGAAEIVSNSWTIFFWSTVHICIMCPIVSLFCCIGAKSAGEPWFFWGNPWFPRVSPKTTILFINHQPIGSTPISHVKCIYRIVGCRIVNPP